MGWPTISDLFSIRWWLEHLLNSYEEDPIHVMVETLCIAVIIFLLFQKSYDPKKTEKLTQREEEDLIDSWTPLPLCPNDDEEEESKENDLVVDSETGPIVTLDTKEVVFNFSSFNFIGLVNTETVRKAAKETIDHYGFGSCGPRGFYGTFDVNLKFEDKIAEFCGTEAAILYSDGLGTISSVIPAFAKRGDLIICDEGCNFMIQQGMNLSRSSALFFKHNDMKDLDDTLRRIRENDGRNQPRKLNRRFIVVEGIYQNYGDVCNLKRVVQLAKSYKYRVVLDDTCAFGVLGKKGRGSPEHWNVPITDIEFYAVHLDMALGTCGGFCAGKKSMTAHQRLSGAGYVFSAAAPPLNCTAGIVNLDLIDQEFGQNEMTKCRENSIYMRKKLETMVQEIDSKVQVIGETEEDIDPIGSPIIHLRVVRSKRNDKEDLSFFKSLARKARAANYIKENETSIWRVATEELEVHENPDSETKENLATPLLHNSVLRGEEKDGWIKHSKGWSPIKKDGKTVLELVKKMGLVLEIPEYVPAERNVPPPSIRIAVTSLHEKDDIDKTVAILKDALEQVRNERRPSRT